MRQAINIKKKNLSIQVEATQKPNECSKYILQKTKDSYRYLKTNFFDAIHEFFHLIWIISSGSHQRPPYLIKWQL